MKALCVLAWLLAATLSLHAQFTFADPAFLASATGAKATEPDEPEGPVEPVVAGYDLWFTAEAGLYTNEAATIEATTEAEWVRAWKDQVSGIVLTNSYNTASSVGNGASQYRLNTINGLPTVQMGGVATHPFGERTGFHSQANFGWSSGSGLTVAAVFKPERPSSTGCFQAFMEIFSIGNLQFLCRGDTQGDNLGFYHNGTASHRATTMVCSNWYIFIWDWDDAGNTTTMSDYGVGDTTTSVADNESLADGLFSIGMRAQNYGDVRFMGRIAEVVVWRESIGTANHTNLINGWKTKYGLP